MVIAEVNNLVFKRPAGFTDTPTTYCPGCTHGVAHRLVAEVLEEMGVIEKTIGVAPVGCSVFAYNYFDTDFVEAPHGRAPAMATGIKRVLPDRIVFTYQGDGDLASIGMGEIVHAAARGENLTVIFINNANFGMTGGQMAPTTLPGMKTTSSPNGRDVETQGSPFAWRRCYPRWMARDMSCAGPCMTRRISVWRRKQFGLPSKPRHAGLAFRWLNCFPPVPQTGA
jgi:2-oxoglutarate ferredoxin oxidoreductase subunit beta